ncbi:A/G-specific adenine glycosylase [Flagellimonas sp. DF-77]|uniref:A/G-specific adenine glycosylase n=1 Tax=Flagellimonas algarum TaxID=3230298 RepID=UPI003393DEC7
MVFSEIILNWYAKNKRDLPWRASREPYRIWLSEVMLQQTRVAQGMPYYEKFIAAYPTVHDLAAAREEEVLKLWQGLGYYSRARNMHATAKTVVSEYQGRFPETYDGLVRLKGVGDYTASAIASICFDLPEPVVDGNVYRVLARYFGVDLAINSSKGATYFKELARTVMAADDIRDYNQGIMEFGAIQCAPRNPDCDCCPLQPGCMAHGKSQVGELPVKIRKTAVKKRYFNYLVFRDPLGKTLLERRTEKGIWQHLYQFPLLESTGELSEIGHSSGLPIEIPKKGTRISLFNEKPIVHKLSHQHLVTKFWIVDVDNPLPDGIAWEALNGFPVPVLIADFIQSVKF